MTFQETSLKMYIKHAFGELKSFIKVYIKIEECRLFLIMWHFKRLVRMDLLQDMLSYVSLCCVSLYIEHV